MLWQVFSVQMANSRRFMHNALQLANIGCGEKVSQVTQVTLCDDCMPIYVDIERFKLRLQAASVPAKRRQLSFDGGGFIGMG